MFLSPLDPSRPRGGYLSLWYRVRRQAVIEDVRLHDLRHTHASHAVMNGVPVPVVSRLLGHADASMTLQPMAASKLSPRAEMVFRRHVPPAQVPILKSSAVESMTRLVFIAQPSGTGSLV